MFVGLPASAPENGHCCRRADDSRAVAQGITLRQLRKSGHLRQALETLLVAEQCENGRQIAPHAGDTLEEGEAAAEGEGAAEGDAAAVEGQDADGGDGVAGAPVRPAEVLGQLCRLQLVLPTAAPVSVTPVS